MTNRVAWTPEDQIIAARAVGRSNDSLHTLWTMMQGDFADAEHMLQREEQAYHLAQEEFHAWAQACQDDDPCIGF